MRNLTLHYAVSPHVFTGGFYTWPPKEYAPLHAVSGYVIQPHTRAQVLIDAVAAKPGAYLVRGFILDYRVGGTDYSAPEPVGMYICVADRSCQGTVIRSYGDY